MSPLATSLILRPARLADAPRLAEIWSREAVLAFSTTDTEARDAAAQRAWLAGRAPNHPVVVACAGEEIAGYAALTAYRPKPAFAHTVEDSVYVDRAWRGHGVGRLLLGRVLELAATRGHRSVIARIVASNQASRGLHGALGFRLVGIEEEVALKRGCWLDVAIYQCRLGGPAEGRW
jgi:phosphinothricin acetyltransferase